MGTTPRLRPCLAGIAALPAYVELVVFLDADASDDPRDLPELLTLLRNGEADLVLGSRALRPRESGSFTPQQAFGNWLATRLMRLLFGARYTDLGPFRAIRRDVLTKLNMGDPNYGWTIEMQIKAHCQKLCVLEIPVHYRRRVAGQSKISGNLLGTLRAGHKILSTIAKHAFSRPHC